MKGKQIAMDSLLQEADFNEQERRNREWAREKEQTDRIVDRLDDRYGRADRKKLLNRGYMEGSVVIIGQYVYRNGKYMLHFYRAVLGYHRAVGGIVPHLVEQQTEEWPDVPPWAEVAGHEGEPRDIGIYGDHLYWITGDVVEQIVTWWMEGVRG